MLDDLNKYKLIKKSKSVLAAEEIAQGVYHKLWSDFGFNDIYWLGAIMQTKALIEALRDGSYYDKKDLLMIIASVKDNEDASNKIKDLVDVILEEFDYKETNHEN